MARLHLLHHESITPGTRANILSSNLKIGARFSHYTTMNTAAKTYHSMHDKEKRVQSYSLPFGEIHHLAILQKTPVLITMGIYMTSAEPLITTREPVRLSSLC